MKDTRKYKESKNSIICWNCANAVKGCSWAREFIPVDGWEAVPTKIKEDGGKRLVDSFIVKKCPEFVADER